MAAISKRATGYQAQIRRRGYPTVSKMFATRRDAEAWARLQESEMDRGVYLDRTEAERTTLSDLLERYLSEVTPLKKSALSETTRIKRLLREEDLCCYKLTALTPRLLADYRDRRLGEVSGSSTNRELSLISHVLNTAIREWEFPIANPVRVIRKAKENPGRERRLTADEEARLLAQLECSSRTQRGMFGSGGMQNPWVKPIVLFALETGMRRGEILSLTWSNVDLSKRVARLVDTKNGEGRSVPLTLKAKALLEFLPRSNDGRVFATTAEAVKLAFARAVARAQVTDLHFHDLRHEAVSRLFEKGLNVMEVSSISGHKTLQMLKRYTHLGRHTLLDKLDSASPVVGG